MRLNITLVRTLPVLYIIRVKFNLQKLIFVN